MQKDGANLSDSASREAQADDQSHFSEEILLEGLRKMEEEAFTLLIRRYHNRLLRLARDYVSSAAVAEEVVQETWLAVLRGIQQFEARSSLKTWIFRILVNRAKTRAVREGRNVPFSSLWDPGPDSSEPVLPLERFLSEDHPQWPGHWAVPLRPWSRSPEQILLSGEIGACALQAIEGLPPNQRQVILLKDVEELSSEEICNILGISETNQRVLLHRARTRVRAALEKYFEGS